MSNGLNKNICLVCGSDTTGNRKVWRSSKPLIKGRIMDVPTRKGEFIGCIQCENILIFDDRRKVIGVFTEKEISRINAEYINQCKETLKSGLVVIDEVSDMPKDAFK